MSKRGADEGGDGNQAYLKRQKLSNPVNTAPTGPEDVIQSGRQLRQLLSFNQDSGRTRHGILLRTCHLRVQMLTQIQVSNLSRCSWTLFPMQRLRMHLQHPY